MKTSSIYYNAAEKDYQLGRTDSIDTTFKKFAFDATMIMILPSRSTQYFLR